MIAVFLFQSLLVFGLLYLSAIALIAGVAHSASLYHVASATCSIGGCSVYESGTTIPGTMALIAGTLYSGLLAAIFVPAFLVMQHVFNQAGLGDETGKSISAKRLRPWDKVRSNLVGLLAVLGPLLAGGPGVALAEYVMSDGLAPRAESQSEFESMRLDFAFSIQR